MKEHIPRSWKDYKTILGDVINEAKILRNEFFSPENE